MHLVLSSLANATQSKHYVGCKSGCNNGCQSGCKSGCNYRCKSGCIRGGCKSGCDKGCGSTASIHLPGSSSLFWGVNAKSIFGRKGLPAIVLSLDSGSLISSCTSTSTWLSPSPSSVRFCWLIRHSSNVAGQSTPYLSQCALKLWKFPFRSAFNFDNLFLDCRRSRPGLPKMSSWLLQSWRKVYTEQFGGTSNSKSVIFHWIW